jgi:hypothetical protein
MRKEGRGKNSPDPFFSFSEFFGRGCGGVVWFEIRLGAPEVYDLRRLRVQPTLPIINIIKSLPSQS